MLGSGFQSGCHLKKPLPIALRQHIGHSRLAGGQCAGLIQNHGIDLMKLLQSRCAFKEDAHFCAFACANHDGNRCGQTQRAGAGDHQNRNGTGQGKLQRLTCQHPNHKHHRCNGHDSRHKNTGNFISQSCNGRLGATGFLHHANDLRKGGILPDSLRLEFQISFCDSGGCGNGIAFCHLHRQTFAGNGALIHCCPSFYDRAVHRDAAAGTDHHSISHPNLIDG